MTRIPHVRTRKRRSSATARLTTLTLALLALVASVAVPAQATTPRRSQVTTKPTAPKHPTTNQITPTAAKPAKHAATLKASKHRVLVGAKVTFSGKIGNVPKGTMVQIQSGNPLPGHEWIKVKSTRTTTVSGTFRISITMTTKLTNFGERAYRAYVPQKGTRKTLTSNLESVNTVVSSTSTKMFSGTRKDRVLVMLSYSSAFPRDDVTPASAQKVMRGTDRWYDAASYGKQRYAATVTNWLKVPTPAGGCSSTTDDNIVVKQGAVTSPLETLMLDAKKAASKAGYKISSYAKYVLYIPCETLDAGLASVFGNEVWLYSRGMTLGTVVHEFGHNLGLMHASSESCQDSAGNKILYAGNDSKKILYTESDKDCSIDSTGDDSSPMGYRGLGEDFAVTELRQLGWIAPAQMPARTSGTIRLTSLATPSGYKGVRIIYGYSKFFSLEYRSGMKTSPDGESREAELLVRDVEAGGSTLLSDLSGLSVGASWTTPQGVRIGVLEMDATGVTIQLTPNYKPTTPSAPTNVTVVASDSAARIYWATPASDGGTPLTRYLITATDNATGKAITTTVNAGALPVLNDPKLPAAKNTTTPTPGKHTWFLNGLTNGTTYQVTIQAVNSLGTSTAVTGTITPQIGLETVPDYERQALIDIYNTNNGPAWTHYDGTPVPITDASVCTWAWIQCIKNDSSVETVNLSSWGVPVYNSPALDSYLTNLPNLTYLYFTAGNCQSFTDPNMQKWLNQRLVWVSGELCRFD